MPRAERPAPYQPAAPALGYYPAGRSVELFDLAATVLATVQLARWVRNHSKELLLPTGRPPTRPRRAARPAGPVPMTPPPAALA